MTVDIVDIRAQDSTRPAGSDLRSQIVAGLQQPAGQKTLPTMLLYDENGLRLYDDITTKAHEYYLFPAEEEILKKSADDIVRAMHAYTLNGRKDDNVDAEEVVVELGAGALRKTSHVLRALARLVPSTISAPPIHYYALDLDHSELARTLTELAASPVGQEISGKVSTQGMCGTYDDGLKYIQSGKLDAPRPASAEPAPFRIERAAHPRDASPDSSDSAYSAETDETRPSTPGSHQLQHIMFLGSSLGNFARGDDVEFLRSLPLRPGSGDTLLIGLDHDNGRAEIEAAYDDAGGVTRAFIMNGLKCAGRALGDENTFTEENWEYVGKYNEEERCHEAYYKSKGDQTIVDPKTGAEYAFEADELIRIEVSQKYSERDAYMLFTEASLLPIQRWTDSTSRYSLWLVERPQFTFPLLSSPKNAVASPFGVPSVEEWHTMWACWDFVTRRMIPPSMLFQKPIDLRHICLFYCGHIPTFLSIHLCRVLKEPDTEPVEYKYIFERGIDPNVDDPTQCHSHSEVPTKDEDWPSLASILMFQSRVRERVLNYYRDVDAGKAVLTRKIARVLFMTYEHEALHAETLLYMLLQRAGTGTIPPTGFSPPQWSLLANTWAQAPKPAEPTVTIGPATITLGHDDDEADDEAVYKDGHEFGWDNEHPKREVQVPRVRIGWRPISNGDFYEWYTAKGKEVAKFPASWIEVNGQTQVRTLYGPVSIEIAWEWPIVTSYDNLSTYASVKGGRIPTEPELRLFMDMFECGYAGGANVGFRHWHPVPATAGAGKDGLKGHNGGVWEWTSTTLEKYDGFVPSRLYPGYSTDFFDGQHQVVMGGSYATIPRLTERRTVRNFYQHNYPYAWVGARIAYDVSE